MSNGQGFTTRFSARNEDCKWFTSEQVKIHGFWKWFTSSDWHFFDTVSAIGVLGLSGITLFVWVILPRWIRVVNYGGGIRTPSRQKHRSLQDHNKNATKPVQLLAKTDTCENHQDAIFDRTITTSEQHHNNSLHKKCAICVLRNLEHGESDLSSELRQVVDLWPKLPEHIRRSITTLVEAYKNRS